MKSDTLAEAQYKSELMNLSSAVYERLEKFCANTGNDLSPGTKAEIVLFLITDVKLRVQK